MAETINRGLRSTAILRKACQRGASKKSNFTHSRACLFHYKGLVPKLAAYGSLQLGECILQHLFYTLIFTQQLCSLLLKFVLESASGEIRQPLVPHMLAVEGVYSASC